MCELIKEDDPKTLENIRKEISNSFTLYQLCTSNKSAQKFSYIYGILTMATKKIINKDQSINAIQTWGIILPFFNAIVEYNRNPDDEWNVKILETLFDEFSLNKEEGIGKLLIDGNVYKSDFKHIKDEFYHFVNLSFAKEDTVLIESVEIDDRFWSSEESIAFKENRGDERLFAFLRALFYVLIRFYFPAEEEIIYSISEDLLKFSKKWYEIEYESKSKKSMKSKFKQIANRVGTIYDIEMRFSIYYLNEFFTQFIKLHEESFLFPNDSIKYIKYPQVDKLDNESILTTQAIIEGFIENRSTNTISKKLHKQIIIWLDFNREILTNIQENEFNIFYIKFIYDQISLEDELLREMDTDIIYGSSSDYTKLVIEAIKKLSSIKDKSGKKLKPGIEDINPFIGTYKIWDIVKSKYKLNPEPNYSKLFTEKFDVIFTQKEKFNNFKNLIKLLFESYSNTLVRVLKSADKAKDLNFQNIILIVYSKSTTFRYSELNIYIKRYKIKEKMIKFTIMNFSANRTRLRSRLFTSQIPDEEEIKFISNKLNIPQNQKIEKFSLEKDIALIPENELQHNSLIWIIWYTECILNRFDESHIKQFFNIFGQSKYQQYIKKNYYNQVIIPKLKIKKNI